MSAATASPDVVRRVVTVPRRIDFGEPPPGSSNSSVDGSEGYVNHDVPHLIEEKNGGTPRQGDFEDPLDDSDVSVREAATALVALFGQLTWSPTLSPNSRRRHRRTNEELTKEFKCTVEGCGKSYASAGALKTHVGLKHVASFSPIYSGSRNGTKSPRSADVNNSPR